MEVKATSRYAGVSPRKVRLLLEHLPGRSVEDALSLLQFMPSPHARLVAKVVKSAAANAENNYNMAPGMLYIKAAVAGDARRLRAHRASSSHSAGRAPSRRRRRAPRRRS